MNRGSRICCQEIKEIQVIHNFVSFIKFLVTTCVPMNNEPFLQEIKVTK